MQFNRYIWNLYKHSPTGKEAINKWKPVSSFPDDHYAIQMDKSLINRLSKKLDDYIFEDKMNWHRLFHDYFRKKDFSQDDAKQIFSTWIEQGILIKDFPVARKNDYIAWTINIHIFSEVLYALYPNYFFPYRFLLEFDKLIIICDEFNIPLPALPHKSDWKKRALLYIDLCESINEFRRLNHFTPQELCAFLYDFAPNMAQTSMNHDMLAPSKAWFVGANKGDFNFLDKAKETSISHWQGNPDARKGDIIVMYCRSPRSYIHSIWRVSRNGFSDPYFYYYNVNFIAEPVRLDNPISHKELKQNHLWSQNPLVKKNLQGINGYPIKYAEYLEFLSMLEEKGQDISGLPRIKPTVPFEISELKDERDVEQHLIEPFLRKMNYTENDWIRQMPVKMGRGERYYPDYSIMPHPKRGEEAAKMILEAKFEIKTNDEWYEAYIQAKSYALRLKAEKFLIGAKEGLWIYLPNKGNFHFEQYQYYTWLDIEKPDILHALNLELGK